MINRLVLLFLIFSFFKTPSLLSQNLKDISEYEFEKYGVEQGTAMDGSNYVFQDKFGYIWVGSQSGMDRFDGYNFTNFSSILSDSLSTNLKWVNFITEDSEGNIWASDQQGNVSKYDRFNEKWHNFYPEYKKSLLGVPPGNDLLFYPQPRSLLISPDNRYAYVGIWGFGLIRIDSKTGEQKYYQDDLKFIDQWFDINSADKMINEMEWLDEKSILIATGDGLRVFDIKEQKFIKEYFRSKNKSQGINWPEDRYWIRNFEIVDENNLWISARNGIIYKANLKEETLENYSVITELTNNGAYDLFYDSKENLLWINVENTGIDILDLNDEKVLKLRDNNSSLSGNAFNNIIKDDQNNIWISSATEGALKFDPDKRKFTPYLRDYPNEMSLGFGVVWGMTFDNDNNLWISTREPGGGILKLDFKNKTKKIFSKNDNNQSIITTLFTDNIGSIWAFQGSLITVKEENFKDFKVLGTYSELRKDSSQFNRFFDPFKTMSGDIVFPGLKLAWIVDAEGNGKFEEYKKITESIKGPITGFHRIDSSNTYIVTDKSIYLWDEINNTFKDLIPTKKEILKKYLNAYQVPAVLHKDILYFGTYGNGILYVNLSNEDMGFITSNEGLPNMYLYNMFKDKNENFWMASNQGIIKYNPYTKIFRKYTPVDGVQGFEFNANTSAISNEGYIAMGGLDGMNYFLPENVSSNSEPPKVIIQNVTIGQKTYKIDASLYVNEESINFSNNSISFEYVAFNFRNTEQNRYKYKMEGYDQEWIEAVDRRFVSYTNLPIGSYTFKVQGSNNDGVWNEEGASFSFTILPPWYRTYFAYASYILLLAFGFRSFGRYQAKKSLEQADNERRAGELEEAKKIQESMLPKVFPSSKQFDVSAGLVTSTEIGGDYYDFFENKNSLYAVCGDATGHGTASGMMVSIIKSGLNGLPALSTNKVLYELNNIVKKIDLGTLKMSLNICEIKKDSITLSSAAMPPIYLYNSKSKKTEEILIRGLPLGGLKNETFEIEKRKFNKGDVLVLLSDGLPEAENDNGELYDYERVVDVINKNASKSADELKSKLIGEVDIWLKGGIPDDDVTIVVVKKI